ncbi:proline--tRNA ligase [bacterium]|jgi:prolyl-tRNA synthetase|nr:proline--tRNA ligase [bacterium]
MSKLPDIDKDFAKWYQEVIYQAELADQAPVRGCIVIRPYGCAVWEEIKTYLDGRIKKNGAQNAIFPLLIPESFLKREAEHVEGFAPEVAVVTYAGGKKLEEPLVIRPTSETIVHHMFARWIKSWRDLPLKINQWANVVRWELRPRAFLRTTEFFWQEGHTAHETKEEAHSQVLTMLDEYAKLAEDMLAIPVIKGPKTEAEKFPGGETTYCFEAIMYDGKALQMGTSHLLAQGFAKSFEIMFQNREGKNAYPYLTSWGVTTRLVGAIIATHGDNKGLIIPPNIAPIQVVIVPIYKKGSSSEEINKKAQELKSSLKKIRVEVDSDESKSPGAKFYKWELKGVPIRIEVGPRDIENNQAVVVDRIENKKEFVPFDKLNKFIADKLEELHKSLFDRALKRQKERWHQGEKLSDFGPDMDKKSYCYQTGWCGCPECEVKLQKYKGSVRCILKENKHKECFGCSKESKSDVFVAKAY